MNLVGMPLADLRANALSPIRLGNVCLTDQIGLCRIRQSISAKWSIS